MRDRDGLGITQQVGTEVFHFQLGPVIWLCTQALKPGCQAAHHPDCKPMGRKLHLGFTRLQNGANSGSPWAEG